MAIKTINDTHLTSIADAIRSKLDDNELYDDNGELIKYTPAEMAPAIRGIKTGGSGSEGSNITFVYVPPTTSSSFDGYVLDLTPYGITLDSQVKFVECNDGLTYVQNLGVYNIVNHKLVVNSNYIFQIDTYQGKQGLICYYINLDNLNPVSIWKYGFILGYEGGN